MKSNQDDVPSPYQQIKVRDDLEDSKLNYELLEQEINKEQRKVKEQKSMAIVDGDDDVDFEQYHLNTNGVRKSSPQLVPKQQPSLERSRDDSYLNLKVEEVSDSQQYLATQQHAPSQSTRYSHVSPDHLETEGRGADPAIHPKGEHEAAADMRQYQDIVDEADKAEAAERQRLRRMEEAERQREIDREIKK